ncbi:hypothetical protein AB0L06_40890 [Spirillospora sp. NPDC052269]
MNVIDEFVGGIGWPGYGWNLQWSADGTRLAVMYRSNNIGVVDPFGEEHGEPDVTVRPTYNGRPDPFAFAPDGLRAYAMDEDSDTYGSIVTFPGLETVPVPLLDQDEDEDEEDDEAYEEEDGAGLVLHWPTWSRDGKRIYGSNEDGRIFSIDVGSREIATVPGLRTEGYRSAFLSWGTRLAVVVPGGHGGPSRVGIADRTGRHLYDVDVAVEEPDGELMVPAWAWAPDGDRAAFLTADKQVEIWSLGDARAERLHVLDVPESTTCLVWGADDVLVAAGPTVLHFVRVNTGEAVGDITLLRQPAAPRPLLLDEEDMGEEVWPGPNPTFALDERTWAAAFQEGFVIAPPGRERELTGTLAWTVDRRHAWPVHWGRLDVFPNARAAAEGQVHESLDEILEGFLDATEPEPDTGEWPPPGPDTLDDLFQVFLESVVEYGTDTLPWAGEALHEAALIRARRGEPDGVRALVAATPERRRPFTAAERTRRWPSWTRAPAAPATPPESRSSPTCCARAGPTSPNTSCVTRRTGSETGR